MISNGQFRVVGYLHPWKSVPDMARVSFEKITHLNIAFVNPDSSGQLILPAGLDTIVQSAHASGVKALVSLGGGSHNPYFAALLSDSGRTSFAQRLIQLVKDHALDGLDIDLENEAIDSNYEGFIHELSRALKPMKKLLTCALASWNGSKISDLALKKFDFINVMSYDHTGPWSPEAAGPHSTYAHAVADLDYWGRDRKIPRKKLNLGLPFYGYCFGTQTGTSMSYSEIITTFPGAEEKDQVDPPTGGHIYYNGMPTIRQKTMLALKKAGGVMIWQLMQDDMGSASLLGVIDQTIHPAGHN